MRHQWGTSCAEPVRNRYGTCIELVWNRDETGQNRTQVRQHRGATVVQNKGAAVVVQWGTSGAAVVRNRYRTCIELVWNRDETGQGRTQVRQHRGATMVQNTGAAVVVRWGSRGAEPVRNRYGTCIELVWNRDENTAES